MGYNQRLRRGESNPQPPPIPRLLKLCLVPPSHPSDKGDATLPTDRRPHGDAHTDTQHPIKVTRLWQV